MATSTKTVTDITAPHYEDLNGSIACFKHIGCSAQGVIENNPKVKAFNTDLTRWVRMTARDKFEFAKFLANNIDGATGKVICESCRGGY